MVKEKNFSNQLIQHYEILEIPVMPVSAKFLMKKYKFETILTTRSSNGMTLVFEKYPNMQLVEKKIRLHPITDFKNELVVSFEGSVPNLFEEGKGVVAEGFLKDRSYLKAVKILAKHDENYMPPEVNEALKDNK